MLYELSDRHRGRIVAVLGVGKIVEADTEQLHLVEQRFGCIRGRRRGRGLVVCRHADCPLIAARSVWSVVSVTE